MRRAFRIYKCRGYDCWQWECTFCMPPARGCRFGSTAYARIIKTSMPNHFMHRNQHHEYVRRNT